MHSEIILKGKNFKSHFILNMQLTVLQLHFKVVKGGSTGERAQWIKH